MFLGCTYQNKLSFAYARLKLQDVSYVYKHECKFSTKGNSNKEMLKIIFGNFVCFLHVHQAKNNIIYFAQISRIRKMTNVKV